MSAALHLDHAAQESRELDTAIDGLMQAYRMGQTIGLDDLAHIRRKASVVRTHAAYAARDLARTPVVDRRPNVAGMAATSPEALARAQALHEALVASTEKLIREADHCLDRRPAFLYAKSVAHTACVQSREVLPAAPKLHGVLWLELEAGEVL